MPSEKAIVNKILDYLNELPGCFAYKTHGGRFESLKGQPDISGCYRGRRFDFEVKRPGKEPTELQKAQIRKFQDAGSVSTVVTSVGEVQDIMQQMETLF